MPLDEAIPSIHYHGHVPPPPSNYTIRLIAKITVFGVKSLIALVLSALIYACFYSIYIPRKHLQIPIYFEYTGDGKSTQAKVILENQNVNDVMHNFI